MKICTTCKQEKDLTCFYKRTKGGILYQHNCKDCAKQLTKEWKDNNPETMKESIQKTKVKTKYGLTLEELHSKLAEQNSKCKICQKQIKFEAQDKRDKPHIDHDHQTGKFRGLLCLTCNTGLGMFGDSLDLLDKASKYIIENCSLRD